MQLDLNKNGKLNLQGELCNIRSQKVKVIFSNTDTGALEFQFSEESSSSIGGISGTVYSEIASTDQFNIYRETFISEDKLTAGVRYVVENKSSRILSRLQRQNPVYL